MGLKVEFKNLPKDYEKKRKLYKELKLLKNKKLTPKEEKELKRLESKKDGIVREKKGMKSGGTFRVLKKGVIKANGSYS